MILNKYYEVLVHYLNDFNSEIYGRELLGKVPLSQKAIALTLDRLEKDGILRSRKQGNIKYFKLNVENMEVKDVVTSLEIMKKIRFFDKQRKLANIFRKDTRIVGVFGSYATGMQRKSSDVDIFIIGKRQKEDYDRNGRLFDVDISIKYFTENEFRKLAKDKNNLCKEIIANHIIVFGVERFIEIIWGDYYGFN